MEQREFESAYTSQFELRSDLGVTVGRILEELLSAEGISTLSIVHRMKTRDSALRKLVKAGEALTNFEQMTDVLGLRVITYMRDDVDAVAKIVEREFTVDKEHSVDKRAILDPDRFGYLSLHYVASLAQKRTALPEYRRFENVRFELQIRSVLQHAWAEIEHDLGYKSESAVPRAERRAFSRLAGLLEIADDEFVRIRDRLTVHQASIEDEVAQGHRDVEIDQDSIYALIRSGDATVDRMDLAIVQFAGGVEATNAVPDREYAGARATQLRRCGFRTLDDLWGALSEHEDGVLSFTCRWLRNDYPAATDLPKPPDFGEEYDPDAVYQSTPERLAELTWPRGVSLYYLALYLRTEETLNQYLATLRWDETTSLEDRARAACLAAGRHLDDVPLM